MSTPHKHAEVIKAWADGTAIQVRCPKYRGSSDFGEWGDLRTPSPEWRLENEYRIKPPREFPKSSKDGEWWWRYYTEVAKTVIPGRDATHRCMEAVANAVIKQYILDTEAEGK